MVVLKKHYEFVDKPAEEVSKGWKACHIIIYFIAAVSGYITYLVISSITTQFNDNCVLYPTISFIRNASDLPDMPLIIDETRTEWGTETLCDFCTYIPLVSMIVGNVFITLFVMCPRGGSRLGQSGIKRPWHIVTPALFITGIFTIFILVSSIYTQNGITAFCAEFETVLNTTRCSRDIMKFIYKEDSFHLNTNVYIEALNVLIWVCLFSWIAAFLLLFSRCCFAVADFKLLEITISTIDNDDDSNLEDIEVLLEQNPTDSPISHV